MVTVILAFGIPSTLSIDVIPVSELPGAEAPGWAIRHFEADAGGTTSFRYVTEHEQDRNNYPSTSPTVFATYPRVYRQRDRDLGQTFVNPAATGRMDQLLLRVGFSERAVLAGANGAEVRLQLFRVSGKPWRDHRGTPGFLGRFDRALAPELDDVLLGEQYTGIASYEGRLPEAIQAGDLLRLTLSGPLPELVSREGYAFMIGFKTPGRDRSMSLANQYYGSYRPDPEHPFLGHGIRREGRPEFPDGDKRWQQTPGTDGFPDVCTYRDLFFGVHLQ